MKPNFQFKDVVVGGTIGVPEIKDGDHQHWVS